MTLASRCSLVNKGLTWTIFGTRIISFEITLCTSPKDTPSFAAIACILLCSVGGILHRASFNLSLLYFLSLIFKTFLDLHLYPQLGSCVWLSLQQFQN